MTDAGARPKVLYVIGTQRGGTTIGGRLIGALPGFAFVGELRKLWQVGIAEGRRCGCGKTYDSCPVWSVVLPRVLQDTDASTVHALQEAAAPDRRSTRQAWRLARGHDADPDAVAGYSAILELTYRALAARLDARVLVDTSKLPADAVLLSRLPNVDAYFLQLVRDPRGTAQSVIRRSARPDGSHVRLALASAAGWSARHAAALAVLRRQARAGRHLVVQYEELIAAPDRVLAEIADFVGEPAPAERVAAHGAVSLDVAHTPIGGGRFVPADIELAVDDGWMSAMNGSDRRVVRAVTWPMARRLGYRRTPAARLRGEPA